MTAAAADSVPVEIVLGPRALNVSWASGSVRLEASQLRAHCRCASCVQSARDGAPVSVAPSLELTGASPVGSYGLQLHFSDGHDRGIYPWVYLRELATPGIAA